MFTFVFSLTIETKEEFWIRSTKKSPYKRSMEICHFPDQIYNLGGVSKRALLADNRAKLPKNDESVEDLAESENVKGCNTH